MDAVPACIDDRLNRFDAAREHIAQRDTRTFERHFARADTADIEKVVDEMTDALGPARDASDGLPDDPGLFRIQGLLITVGRLTSLSKNFLCSAGASRSSVTTEIPSAACRSRA